MTKETAINTLINQEDINTKSISDGYHTFGELYDHRIILYITLSRLLHSVNSSHKIWRTIKHSDNSIINGWFVMGINEEAGSQITYHLPIEYWDECRFAETLDKAPEYDNHSSKDVLLRLKNISYVNNPV